MDTNTEDMINKENSDTEDVIRINEEFKINMKKYKYMSYTAEWKFYHLAEKEYKKIFFILKFHSITFLEWEQYVKNVIESNVELNLDEINNIISYEEIYCKERKMFNLPYYNGLATAVLTMTSIFIAIYANQILSINSPWIIIIALVFFILSITLLLIGTRVESRANLNKIKKTDFIKRFSKIVNKYRKSKKNLK